MNGLSVVLTVALAAAAAVAVRHLFRHRKDGGSCGCCTGNCASCLHNGTQEDSK